MINELIFFIDQSEISIFKKDYDNYENVKIRGEELFQYESLSDSLIFLEEYLKNVLGLQTYNKTSLLIFSKNEIGINHKEIQNVFKTKNITFLSFDVVQAYHNILKAQCGEKAKELEKKLDNEEKLKNLLIEIKKDYEMIQNSLIEKEKEIIMLTEKAKLWDNYLIEKSKIKRAIICYKDAKRGKYGLHLNVLRSIMLLKANGESVKTNGLIGRGLYQVTSYFSGVKEGAIWKASREGYIYWLTSNIEKKIPLKDFNIKVRKGNVALAVISDSPSDKIEDILEFVKKEISKEIKI